MTTTTDLRADMMKSPKARLQRVAHLLRTTVDYGVFVMDTWVCLPGDGADDTEHSRLVQERVDGNDCGFAGCAVGHASMDPVLQAEGLPRADSGRMGWDAVEDFFGLSHEEALQLFSLDAYDPVGTRHPDQHEVAHRIDKFVETLED